MKVQELSPRESIEPNSVHNINVSLVNKSQSIYPKPSLFNFLLFVIFILCLGLFHYRPNNQRLNPIIPQYFQHQIFAGEVHYSRIPVEYWEHRIIMIKAMGLNTLSVYVMWNFHEVEKGVFDYETGNRNLSYFIELCVKHQLKILFRPGPYVCAQWDLGGLPARLLSIENLTLRSSNKKYLQQVQTYFQSLAPIIRPFIRNPHNTQTFNNPIIMLQIQNEYGFYGTDKWYILALRRMWRRLDVHCEQYYVDWIENVKSSYWENANVGINNGYGNNVYHMVSAIDKNGMLFGGEIYSGWYKKWGDSPQPVSSLDDFVDMYCQLLRNRHSFSVYLVHGGTNFALTAGANFVYNSPTDYAAVITSYDYESPITQNGNVTQKYFKFRELIQGYLSYELPPIPQPIPAMNTQNFTLVRSYSFMHTVKNVSIPTYSKQLVKFQSETLKMFNQGAVLYCNQLQAHSNYLVQIQAHDFAIVFVNNNLVQVINRSAITQKTFNINCVQSDTCSVEILVEAMGHINFGTKMQYDFKGLIQLNIIKLSSFLQNNSTVFKPMQDWKIYKINLENQLSVNSNESNRCLQAPQDNADTFIDLSRYQKGYVWVNGHNLGRYWNIGPQYRLYCPGVWLIRGKNIITVLDLLETGHKQISGKSSLY